MEIFTDVKEMCPRDVRESFVSGFHSRRYYLLGAPSTVIDVRFFIAAGATALEFG